MVIIRSAKLLVFGMLMIPVAFASLSVGVLFASYNLAVSNNPDETDNIYSQTLIFFALIETFVFVALGIAVAAISFIH
jgi:F0F1-type ATP synthase membrane subunit c/vacuolar-type H+-ATPase subunit K